MRTLVFVCFFLLLTSYMQAQLTLVKQWDWRFGGTETDDGCYLQQTKDGGYILGGQSFSGISGDKTQPNWDPTGMTADFWLVKIDSVGNKQWDRRYGGTEDDGFSSMTQALDGGYLLTGFSYSGISGDKTQVSRGDADFWIIKIDSTGNKQWDKRYGGTKDDTPTSAWQTKDGGYIIGGYSYSRIGGDKTQDNWDTTSFYNDYWVVRIDSVGNKLWDRCFGGVNQDDISSLQQTNDGGYILGGYSASDSGGDKTQHLLGLSDYWIVKIDSSGNKLWDRDFGGSNEQDFRALQQTNDGGYILGGNSYSDNSGNKIAKNQGFWIVKIDAQGAHKWDRAYTAVGYLGSIAQVQDGGYLIGGSSTSNISGDKTENNLGQDQTWVVKTDSLGNKQWDKTLFTYGSNAGYAIQTKDGCYAFANATYGNVGGYKTQASWGVGGDSSFDYWIVKFCFDSLTGLIGVTPEIQLSIYPNPFTSDLNILLQKQDLKQATFTITNPLGQIIYTKQENNLSPSYTKMLDLSYLPNGVYFVEVEVDGQRETKKVVKSGP